MKFNSKNNVNPELAAINLYHATRKLYWQIWCNREKIIDSLLEEIIPVSRTYNRQRGENVCIGPVTHIADGIEHRLSRIALRWKIWNKYQRGQHLRRLYEQLDYLRGKLSST